MLAKTQDDLALIRTSISNSKTPVAIDLETNYTNHQRLRFCLGIAVSFEDQDWYIPVGHKNWAGFDFESSNLQVPPNIFADISADIIFHNAKGIDLPTLDALGVHVPRERIWDTMIMHHYIDENIKKKDGGHDLETLSKRYLKEEKLNVKKIDENLWPHTPPYLMEKYATRDSRNTLDLYSLLKEQMKPAWIKEWDDYDRRFMLLLMKIEQRGIPIDRDLCEQWEAKCDLRMQQIQEELGFDPAKPSQLHPRLFDNPPRGLGLDIPSRTPTHKPQISAAWLQQVGHPMTALTYEYRKTSKQKSSYFSAYLRLTTRDYARLHCHFNQNGTVTGRLSSSEPNLQQIPREEYGDAYVKEVFLPEEGKQLWEIDYRTLEYRMSTVYSQEPSLLEVFRNEGDFHQQVADDLNISRHSAKTVNYIMSFGGGIEVLGKQLGISKAKAEPIHKAYRSKYPLLFRKMSAAEVKADVSGEIDMWYGRTRHFQYPSEHRKAFNAVIQGGSFEIVKRSMLLAQDAGADISNQVHDSVWINVEKESEVEELQHVMSDWTTKPFGLTFSTDRKCLKSHQLQRL